MSVITIAGRAFCGWLCPLGAIQDYLARLGAEMERREAARSRQEKSGNAWKPAPSRT